jgi:tRNA wybutosine-synthesizing protein 4
MADPDQPLLWSVLCPQDSKAVVGFVGRHFSTAAMVIYEQVKPDDAFGRQMCTNLMGRGCPLRGVHATPTPEAHCMRMRDNGWATATCHDMDTIYLK